LLSICIPTYNRAPLLKEALDAVGPQIDRNKDVEVIVSDNASTDSTAEVVKNAQRRWKQIRYCRNQTNVGLAGNFVHLSHELARGVFCWIIGDDDIILPDAVDRILSVLNSHPEIDFVLLNKLVVHERQRGAYLKMRSNCRIPKEFLREDVWVPRWEMLLDPSFDEWFLTGIMVNIFRLSVYTRVTISTKEGDHLFSGLENTYPHIVIFTKTMLGRSAYYIGTPCVIAFWGHAYRNRVYPLVLGFREQELLDLYEQVGVDRSSIDKFRRLLIVPTAISIQRTFRSNEAVLRDQFSRSICNFLSKYRRHPVLLIEVLTLFMVLPWLNSHIPTSIISIMVTRTRKSRRRLLDTIEHQNHVRRIKSISS
jgi:glycosyltransferase involved in cell wall biosynthesis